MRTRNAQLKFMRTKNYKILEAKIEAILEEATVLPITIDWEDKLEYRQLKNKMKELGYTFEPWPSGKKMKIS